MTLWRHLPCRDLMGMHTVLRSGDFLLSPQRLCTPGPGGGAGLPVAGRAWRFAEQDPDGRVARGAQVSPAGPSTPAQLSSFCPLKRGTELRPELRHIQAGCGSHRVPSGSHWLALTGGWGSLALPPALRSQGLDRACRSLLSASQQAETSAPEATRCDTVLQELPHKRAPLGISEHLPSVLLLCQVL